VTKKTSQGSKRKFPPLGVNMFFREVRENFLLWGLTYFLSSIPFFFDFFFKYFFISPLWENRGDFVSATEKEIGGLT
jgi:hypothetical protein